MGYMHIENLYRNQDILLFRECYALEKIHGTSAHISWDATDISVPNLSFYSGGESHERFMELFDVENLTRIFTDEVGADAMTVYGEAYGGKQQGMSKTYGKELKFIVFDVKVGDFWLDVPKAEDVAIKLGLEFMAYARVSTDIEALDAERDRDSTQAVRNGVGEGCIREGVVLRPLIEVVKNNGKRVICKHKRVEFSERKSIPNIDPTMQKLMTEAGGIADEWVTPMRLTHVLDKMGNPCTMSKTGDVIKAMIEDVTREAEGEIVNGPGVTKAIGRATVNLYKQRIMKVQLNG